MTDIKIGDTVRVVDGGQVYATFRKMSYFMGLLNYVPDELPTEGALFKVIAKERHLSDDCMLLGIEADDESQYIIGLEGVVKVEEDSLSSLGLKLFGTKIEVNPETSKLIQEAVFAAGGSWANGEKYAKYYLETHTYHLYISETGVITLSIHKTELKNNHYKEVKVGVKRSLIIEEFDEELEKVKSELAEAEKKQEELAKTIETLKSKLNK